MRFEKGDTAAAHFKRAFARRGFAASVIGNPEKDGSSLRVRVGAEFMSILGLGEDGNAAELMDDLAAAIPDSKPRCHAMELNE